MNTVKPATIDEYIAAAPVEARAGLEAIRAITHEEAPEATEAIKYDMPTFVLNGNMLCFGAFKDHLSIFPLSSRILNAIPELEAYKQGAATAKFPLKDELPLDLVRELIVMRAAEYRTKKTKAY